jgi:hypothetical protein
MGVLQIIAKENFITYSKVVARKLGVNAAVLLGQFCSYQNLAEGEFYREQSLIAEDTCLSIYEIRKAVDVLVENELLVVERKGVPAKNFYKIDENKLSDFLISRCEKFTHLEVENLDISYKEKNKCENNNYNKKEEEEKKTSNLPVANAKEKSLDEVIEAQPISIQQPLREFVKMRKAIKKPITTHGLELAVKKLHELAKTESEAVAVIEQSVMNSWQGFFALKKGRSETDWLSDLKDL